MNDLATLDPALAAEWHPTRNTDFSPDLVSPGYKGEVWWQPSCGHYFPRSPLQRKGDCRCQVCVDKRVFPGQNDFATLHPDLVGDLSPGQNLDLGQIRATSRQRSVRWVASCGHTYTATPMQRHENQSPPTCSKCQPVKLTKLTKRGSLPTVNQVPWLLALWDPAANTPLKASDVKAGENRRLVAWRCANGHTWKRRPRTQKADCGYCTGRDLLSGFNDLATVNPALAAQWHPTKNGDLAPDQFLPMANRVVWWRGPCGDEWEARIANRSNGSGCRERHEGTRVPPVSD